MRNAYGSVLSWLGAPILIVIGWVFFLCGHHAYIAIVFDVAAIIVGIRYFVVGYNIRKRQRKRYYYYSE